MCEPATAMMAMTAVSGGVSAYGQYKGAKNQKIALAMEAEAARTNSAIALGNGQLAATMGEINARDTETQAGINARTTELISDLNASLTTHMADNAFASSMAQAQIIENTAEANLEFSELQAENELKAGQRREQASRLSTAALRAQQRNQLAANGVVLDADTSAMRLLTSTEYMGEVEATTIHNNAVMAALGVRMQGKLAKMSADADLVAYKAEALGTKLSAGIEATNYRMAGLAGASNLRTQAMIDAGNMRSQAREAKMNATIQAGGYNNQATAAQAARASINPGMILAGSLLETGAKVAGQWYTASQKKGK